MKSDNLKIKLELAFVLCLMLFALESGSSISSTASDVRAPQQETFPAPPVDRTLIYLGREKNTVMPLPLEQGATPLSTTGVARNDKISYIELKGERAVTSVASEDPRFYLYVPDQTGVHPPFLVRLTTRRGARRVTATAQRGQRGFAILSDEIVKPAYRVLSHEGDMLFMEIRSRQPLLPGEYAFVGADLQRIATFRVTAASNP